MATPGGSLSGALAAPVLVRAWPATSPLWTCQRVEYVLSFFEQLGLIVRIRYAREAQHATEARVYRALSLRDDPRDSIHTARGATQ
ncbi:uncharacterized protein C8Q71DRAFT_321573 [Rhodofomes roseus]|uniref:Uncharacterized protein n=1 Tax=Rhodofomes roseus TaxID=34475 RepID=A0ABQ8K1X4_9APHY|nr:uncharacterized protein C8Q71DRAFT_321573 [Rhodofomes roseus]KAH9830766.1 hypothetical protein C8Q71DRAFT_321573 [Rhodofomes roseus]